MTITKETVSKPAQNPGAPMRSLPTFPASVSGFKGTAAQAVDRTCTVEEGLPTKILTALQQIDRLPASEAEIDQFFKFVVEMSAIGTGADCVSLVVKDKGTGKFVPKAQTGRHQPAWEQIWQGDLKIGEPVLLDEASQNHALLHSLMTEAGIPAMLHIPLVVDGHIVGAINNIKAANGARFSASDLNFAATLGWWSSKVVENARLLATVHKQRLHIEKLLHEISLAQQNERRRVATEIHDGVAQWMVAASYEIRVCSSLLSESSLTELEVELTKIGKTLQRSVRELRRAIADLRPLPLQKVGLLAAIQQAMEALTEDGIRCHTKVTGRLPKLTLAEENTTYWIVQEVVTNVRRHSRASDVNLRIRSSDSTVSVEVSDNGQGFNANDTTDSTMPLRHMGLVGMQERARLLGGDLSIRSSPGQGTTIGFTFPVSSRVAGKTKA